MSKLLAAVIAEQRRLKESGWTAKFRGDTGINICQVMIDNDIEWKEEQTGLLQTFKEIKNAK